MWLAFILILVIIVLALFLYFYPTISDNPLFISLGSVAAIFPFLYLLYKRFFVGNPNPPRPVILAAETCVRQLIIWFNQVSYLFSYLRENVDKYTFGDFAEILTQLQLQIDQGNPINLTESEIKRIIERNCPDFDAYARAKGTLRAFATDQTISEGIREQINGFLELCEEAERTVRRVKNPGWYDPGHPERQKILADAISDLNTLRLRLNEHAEILVQN